MLYILISNLELKFGCKCIVQFEIILLILYTCFIKLRYNYFKE